MLNKYSLLQSLCSVCNLPQQVTHSHWESQDLNPSPFYSDCTKLPLPDSPGAIHTPTDGCSIVKKPWRQLGWKGKSLKPGPRNLGWNVWDYPLNAWFLHVRKNWLPQLQVRLLVDSLLLSALQGWFQLLRITSYKVMALPEQVHTSWLMAMGV